MNFKTKCRPILLLAGAGLLLGANAAQAIVMSSLSQTVVTAFVDVFPETTTDWSHTFCLPQFNPALGTLESVNILASQTMNMTGTIRNTSTRPQNFSLRAGSLLTVDLPGGFGFLQPSPLATAEVYQLPSGGVADYGPVSSTDTVSYAYTRPQDLDWFVGTGTFTLPGTTQTQEIILGGGGNIWARLNTVAGAAVEVQYTYRPSQSVPEATTFLDLSLLLLLPLGAGIWRKLARPATA